MKKAKSLKKFLLLVIFSVFLCVFTVYVLSLLILRTNLSQEIQKEHISLTQSIGTIIENYLQKPKEILKSLCLVIEKKELIEEKRISAFLNSQIQSFPYFESIQIIDFKGIVTHITPFNPNLSGIDLSGADFFLKIKSGTDFYWSTSFISLETGYPTLIFATRSEQKIIAGQLNLANLASQIQKLKLSKNTFITVTDENGIFIAHPDINQVKQRTADFYYPLYHHQKEEKAVSFFSNFNNKEFFTTAMKIKEFDWTILIHSPTEEIFEPLKNIFGLFLPILFISLILAGLIIRKVIQKLTSSFSHFISQSRMISDGNYLIHLDKQPYLELNVLAENFDQMKNKIMSREKAIEEKSAELDRYFSVGLDLFCIADTNGFFRRLNPVWEKTLGYSLKELEGHFFLDFIHPDDMPETLNAIQKLKEQKEVLSFINRYRSKDGSYRWIEWKSFPSGEMIYAAARDITERKHMEEKIKENERQFRSLFNTMAQGIVYQNSKGEIILANQAAEEILGLSLNQMLGMTSMDTDWHAIHEDGSLFSGEEHPAMQSLKTGKEIKNIIMGIYHPKEKRHRWTIINAVPEFKEGEDRPYQVYATITDITNLKLAEQKLMENEEKFRSLFNSMNEMAALHELIYDSKGNPVDYRILDCNPSYEKILGIKRIEAIGTLASVLYGIGSPPYLDIFSRVSLTGKTEILETRFEPMKKDFIISVVQIKKDHFATITTDITARKEIERKMKESEERYRFSLEGANDGIWEVNMTSNQFYISPRGCEILGYTSEEMGLVAKIWKDLVHPDDMDKTNKALQNYLEGKTPLFEIEQRLKMKDGQWKWILTRGKVTEKDQNGSPLRMNGTHTDITVRKQIETELRYSEEKFRNFFDFINDAILVNDIHTGRILEVNQRMSEMYGYSKSEVSNLRIIDISQGESPFSEKEAMEWIQKTAQGTPQVFEWLAKDKNSRLFWTEVNMRKALIQGQERIIIAVRDISEQKKNKERILSLNEELEEKVLERTAQFEAANEELQASNEELALSNQELEKTLSELKEAQNQLILSEKMAVLGQLIAGIAHEINTPLAAIRSSNQNILLKIKPSLTQLLKFFTSMQPKEKKIFTELFEVALSKNTFVSSLEQRKLKTQMVLELEKHQIQQAEEIADYLCDCGVLYGVEKFLPILKGKNGLRIAEILFDLSSFFYASNIIDNATEKAAKVIQALKTYAHQDLKEKQEITDVQESIETVLTLYYNKLKHGVELLKDYKKVSPVFSYPDRLNQIWANLINNALQAMEYKGILKISLKEQKNWITVSFTDNGPGIPKEIQSKIFTPFFTTKKAGEGSGLGLDICRKILEELGGKIEFESEPGKTTFKVFLKKPGEIQ